MRRESYEQANAQDRKAIGASIDAWRRSEGSTATVEQDDLQAQAHMEHAQNRTMVLTVRTAAGNGRQAAIESK